MKTGNTVFRQLVKHRRRIVSLLVFIMSACLLLTGMTWNIDESGNTVRITADGVTVTVRAGGETVAQVLEREGVILGEYDEINFLPEEYVTEGMDIIVSRVEYVERTTSEAIPYETVYIDSTLATIGTSEIRTAGREGRLDTTVREKIVNGKTVYSHTFVTGRIAPVNEEITVGTALGVPYSRREGDFTLENGIPSEYVYCIGGKVTAYTAPEGSGTYSGRPLEIGTVGVDPDIIPFGSEVYVCSKDGKHVYGYAIAADAGYLTDVVADVYMGTTRDNLADACEWGAQDAYVFVLTVGDNSILW